MDWSGAFGQDPAQLADRQAHTGGNEVEYGDKNRAGSSEDMRENEDDSSGSDTDESDLGLHDANHQNHERGLPELQVDGHGDSLTSIGTPTKGESTTKLAGKGLILRAKEPMKQLKNYREDKQELHRKHKGPMQWRPVRNLQFAKDEAKFAVRRAMNKGTLRGRRPDVESEF